MTPAYLTISSQTCNVWVLNIIFRDACKYQVNCLCVIAVPTEEIACVFWKLWDNAAAWSSIPKATPIIRRALCTTVTSISEECVLCECLFMSRFW